MYRVQLKRNDGGAAGHVTELRLAGFARNNPSAVGAPTIQKFEFSANREDDAQGKRLTYVHTSRFKLNKFDYVRKND